MGRIRSGISQREKGGLHRGIPTSMKATPAAFAPHPSVQRPLLTTHLRAAPRYFSLYRSYVLEDELDAAKEQLK